jgi:hypothetical protein
LCYTVIKLFTEKNPGIIYGKKQIKFLVENQKSVFEIDILKSKRYLSCTEKIKVNEFTKKNVERVSLI